MRPPRIFGGKSVPGPNPDHLLDRAEASLKSRRKGAPRQTDLRRAISDSYYTAFHAVLAAAADIQIGKHQRGSSPYSLVYRSIDHRTIRELCLVVGQSTPPKKYVPHMPSRHFGAKIRNVADNFLTLQWQRTVADYDPAFEATPSEASSALKAARDALTDWADAPAAERRTFLHLLLFPPR
jgi:uncharacterized protein (UPF0332 family)